MSLVLFGLYPDFNGAPLSRDVHILYHSFSKPIWALGLGFIIFSCNTSNGGFVTKLLSLSFWKPLSRLSYCAYLIHYSVIRYYGAMQNRLIYYSEINLVNTINLIFY